MGGRTSYPPGTFSWVDLATTDAAAAKSFYTGLFGWELDETDAAYTICRLDGDAVCGLYEPSEDIRATGVPPGWTSDVTVADAAAAAARARELGGDVVDDASEFLDLGRVAVLKDPQGAVFAVWQPRERIGAERVNDVGCLCMNELATSDMEAARSFYGRLFGWTIEVSDGTREGPWMVSNGENINGSLFAAPDGAPAQWRTCFTVESTERSLARVGELGGRQLGEPLDIGHGSVAMALDAQGALFTMFAGEVDP